MYVVVLPVVVAIVVVIVAVIMVVVVNDSIKSLAEFIAGTGSDRQTDTDKRAASEFGHRQPQ